MSRSRAHLALKRSAYLLIGPERASALAARGRDARSAAGYLAHPAGRRSRARIRALEDRYAGERCFIVGSGPSLRNQDLTRLRSEHCITLNRGYLLDDLRPAFHVCINRLVAQQFSEELRKVPAVKLFAWSTRDCFPSPSEDIIFVRTMERIHFSEDPAVGLWEGSTVTFAALQLAFYFGFDPVVLVGVDHHFVTKGAPNQVVSLTGADPNHFSPDYFGRGTGWQLPDLQRSELAYQLARRHYERAGRSILDATDRGRLEVFEKANYAGLF